MILLGANSSGQQIFLNPAMANRHGLIAGATGTGKTVTLQVLAEGFSKIGVPVFTADVKGDLSGIAAQGKPHPKVDERIEKIGITNYQAKPYPLRLWDIHGKTGHLVKTTISAMGADLISSLLELTESQDALLRIAFSYAREKELPLLNINDLKHTIMFMQDNRKTLEEEYGNISSRSLGALLRKLLVLEEQGGEQFFGEPALNIEDFMQTKDGMGVINLLDGRELILQPRVYTVFLLWFLSALFEQLDERGDADKPRLVFFFDEAHLLFDNAPKALLERVEQVVRLIRSKGVGVYFVTQSPSDIPDDVLGQLGNRIQHALRAYTPKDKKAVRVAADTFRQNPDLDTKTVITELGVGEALISTLDDEGVPSIVEQTLIVPPESQIGPIDESSYQQIIKSSSLYDKYSKEVDNYSAEEMLLERKEEIAEEEKKKAQREAEEKERLGAKKASEKKTSRARGRRQGLVETFGKTLVRSIARGVANSVLSGLNLKRRRRRRR